MLSCYKCCLLSRGMNIPFTGSMRKTQVRITVQTLHVENFRASNRWLKSLKTRHYPTLTVLLSGELAGVDVEAVED